MTLTRYVHGITNKNIKSVLIVASRKNNKTKFQKSNYVHLEKDTRKI